jgi:hypothetical protein
MVAQQIPVMRPISRGEKWGTLEVLAISASHALTQVTSMTQIRPMAAFSAMRRFFSRR